LALDLTSNFSFEFHKSLLTLTGNQIESSPFKKIYFLKSSLS